jgi:hypothetical protein
LEKLKKKMKRLIAALALMLAVISGYSQKYQCNVEDITAEAYSFTLKNVDSIKKYTPVDKLTVSADVAKGGLKKLAYYTGFGTKTQKEVKPWTGLDEHLKVLFSLCPDSYFYSDTAQVTNHTFEIPLNAEAAAKAMKSLTSRPARVNPIMGRTEIAADAKFTINLKRLSISGAAIGEKQLTGNLKEYSSGILQLTPEFHIVIKVDAKSDAKVNYLSYKFIELINYKSAVITQETRRPIANNKVHVTVKGIRENNGVPEQPLKDFEAEFEVTFN